MIPKLSVVIPVRNAERTLAGALESCLGQSFSEFELIIVLNGCDDCSADIAGGFAQRDRRVRVLESAEEGGVIEAQRSGIAAARAEVLARMDADDLSHPERFAKQWMFLERSPSVGAVGCGVRLIEAQGEGMQRYVDWVNGLKTPEAIARERFVECPLIQPSLMMQRWALNAVGGYRVTSWAEDHDLILRMLGEGISLGTVPETLFEWRDGPGRLTRCHPMYAEDQVWLMKAEHLGRLDQVRGQGVAISGAGPIGKRLGRHLEALGVMVHGYFEVSQRRIGQKIGGVPVVGAAEVGVRWRDAVLLSAVGVPGGRGQVRALAEGKGYVEGKDFWCCC